MLFRSGIDLGENALVLAPSAKALLRAGIWRVERLGTSAALQTFVSGNGFGQVYFDSGAAIDVAGTVGAAVSVADNVVAVQLGGTELADAPLLRNGLLRGKTIYVDARDTGTYNGKSWVGTPLADASGYVNLIQRSVAELTTAGGNVTIKAGESVVMQPGSAIDVSGGWVNYQGANKQVTRLVSAGKSILASQATPDRIYDYAITTTEYEAGYVQGKDGGSLSITAPSMALDGKLVGRTVTGPRQQFQAPKPGSLTLAFQAQDLNNTLYVPYSPTPPAIRFDTTSALAPADPFALDGAGKPVALRSDRKSQVVLAPDLIGANGFGSFTLDNSDGSVTLPAGVELRNLPGGTITFEIGRAHV